jgi:hypothetical protein
MPIFIQAEEHRALESITLGQDSGKGRTSLFSSVFMVACNEDDVLTLAGPGFPLVDQRAG